VDIKFNKILVTWSVECFDADIVTTFKVCTIKPFLLCNVYWSLTCYFFNYSRKLCLNC
jgi:hypothetical protein